MTADVGSSAQGAHGLKRSPLQLMSHGLLPDREEMAGEEAAVVPLVHSTDTQCRLRAHNYPRYQGSAVNRAQARGAACLVQPLQGLGPVENSKTIIKPTLNLVCCYCHTVLAIQTTTCKIFLSIGEVLPLSCPSHTTAAAATANKTSPKPCPHGACTPRGESGGSALL